MTVSLKKSASADEVYEAVVKKIGLSKKVSRYFYLFEIVEYNFGKLCYLLLLFCKHFNCTAFFWFQNESYSLTNILIIFIYRITVQPRALVYVLENGCFLYRGN